MATVPRYDNQVAPAAINTPQFRAPDPGQFQGGIQQVAQFGQAVRGSAGVGGDILLKVQERENVTAVAKAEAALIEADLAFQREKSQLKLDAAKGITEESKKWWDENPRKIADSLENDEQRRAFDLIIAKRRAPSFDWASKHETAEGVRAADAAFDSNITAKVQSAASNYYDDVATTTEKESGLRAIDSWAVTKGLAAIDKDGKIRANSEDAATIIADKKLAFTTKLHAEVLQNLVRENPTKAQQVFDVAKGKGEISGTAYETLDRMIKPAATARAAESAVESALAATGGDYGKALTSLREKLTGDEEKAATDLLNHRMAQNETVRKEKQRGVDDQAWKIAIDHGVGIHGLQKRFPDVYSNMSPAMSNAIRAEVDQQRRAAEGRANDRKTDPDTYYKLRQMIKDDPATFKDRAKTDLRTYAPKLSRSDFEEFVRLQTAADKDLKDVASLDKQLSVMHGLMKWNGTPHQEKRSSFDQYVINKVREQEERTGKKLDDTARQAIINEAVEKGKVIFDWWPDSSKMRFEVEGTPDAARWKPDKPKPSPAQIPRGGSMLDSMPTSGIKTITSRDEWARLPAGTRYIYNGKESVKK